MDRETRNMSARGGIYHAVLSYRPNGRVRVHTALMVSNTVRYSRGCIFARNDRHGGADRQTAAAAYAVWIIVVCV